MAKETEYATNDGIQLCAFIQAHREDILMEWERRVRAFPAAERLSSPALRDHVPLLLERICDFVQSVHTGQPGRLEDLPDLHALERLEAGFDPGI
jgi:hypothetical protein